MAHAFRSKCVPAISQAQVNELMAELNKIWRNREQKSVQRVQNEAHRELQFLRR